MLGRKTYMLGEVDQAQRAVFRQLAAYKKLVRVIEASTSDAEVSAALDEFEPLLFNSMTLVLDRYFVHRLRVVTGKDSNPLNEVELISDSLMNNDGLLRGNNVIKLRPEETVLNVGIGEPIRVTATQFEALAKGFFAELHGRFVQETA